MELNGHPYFNADRETQSLFSWTSGTPTKEDIEYERQRLEALYHCQVTIHTIDHPTLAGRQYTRVTWEMV